MSNFPFNNPVYQQQQQFAGLPLSADQQNLYYQQQQQQWQVYAQQYQSWYEKYGEQYSREMQKAQGPPLPPPPSDPQPPKPPEPEPPIQPAQQNLTNQYSYTQTAVIAQPPLPSASSSQPPPPPDNQDQSSNFQQQQNNQNFGGRNNNFGGNQRGGGSGRNNNNNNNNNRERGNWSNRDDRDNRNNRGGFNRDRGKNRNQNQNQSRWADRDRNSGNNDFSNQQPSQFSPQQNQDNQKQNQNQQSPWQKQQNQQNSQQSQRNQQSPWQSQQGSQQNQQAQQNPWQNSQNSQQNLQNLQKTWQSQDNKQQNASPQKQQTTNTDSQAALKKAIESMNEKTSEELTFDEQFRNWEQDFENWKKANVDHPDKRTYREYEMKFEECRSRLLERREMMRRKKMESLGITEEQIEAFKNPPPPVPEEEEVQEVVMEEAEMIDETELESSRKSYYDEDSTAALGGWLSKSSAGIPGLDLVGEETKKVEEPDVIVLEEESPKKSEKPKDPVSAAPFGGFFLQNPITSTSSSPAPSQKPAIPSLLGPAPTSTLTSQTSIETSAKQQNALDPNLAQILQNKDLMALLAASLQTSNTNLPASIGQNIGNIAQNIGNVGQNLNVGQNIGNIAQNIGNVGQNSNVGQNFRSSNFVPTSKNPGRSNFYDDFDDSNSFSGNQRDDFGGNQGGGNFSRNQTGSFSNDQDDFSDNNFDGNFATAPDNFTGNFAGNQSGNFDDDSDNFQDNFGRFNQETAGFRNNQSGNFGGAKQNQSGNFSRNSGNNSNNFANQRGGFNQNQDKPKIKSLLDIDPFEVPEIPKTSFDPQMEDNTSRMSDVGSVRSSIHSFHPYEQENANYNQQNSEDYHDSQSQNQFTQQQTQAQQPQQQIQQPQQSQTNFQCEYFVANEVHDHDHRPIPRHLYEEDRYFKPTEVIDYNHISNGMFDNEPEPQRQQDTQPAQPPKPFFTIKVAKRKRRNRQTVDYLQIAEPEETVSNPSYPGKWVPLNIIERPPTRNKRYKKKTAKIISILRAKQFQDEERMREQLAKAAEEDIKENLEEISSSESDMDEDVVVPKVKDKGKENNEPPVPGMESVDIKPQASLFKIDIPEEDIKKELVVTRNVNCRKYAINIENVLMNPGRKTRPKKIVIILRGTSGSGKSYLAKLIKDKELALRGSAPRLLSLDDYFLVENEQTRKCEKTGRKIVDKKMVYEYEASMEPNYIQCLIKSFKKTISDGLFDFIIVDSNNESLKTYNEFHDFAKLHGFTPYTCELEMDPDICFKRNIHGRTLEDIKKTVAAFQTTPDSNLILNPTSLFQMAEQEKADKEEEIRRMEEERRAVEEFDAEDMNIDDFEVVDEIRESDESDNDNETEPESKFGEKSKWEVDQTEVGLARLDGTNKPLKHQTMEDYLQLEGFLEEPAPAATPGKKRVRWADIEEKRAQQKMRAIGFVVGQTDWKRMMDPTKGESALTQTKYIERVRKKK